MRERLFKHFCEAWDKIGAVGDPTEPFLRIMNQYQMAGIGLRRVYHTDEHAEEVVENLIPIKPLLKYPAETIIAATTHDADYNTFLKDCEKRSANFIRSLLLEKKVERVRANRVHSFVMTTDHLRITKNYRLFDIRALLDSDLAILGAPEEKFDFFDNGIRIEYAHIPDEKFFPARVNALKKLKGDRKYYFRTTYFRERFEAQANINVARAIERWSNY